MSPTRFLCAKSLVDEMVLEWNVKKETDKAGEETCTFLQSDVVTRPSTDDLARLSDCHPAGTILPVSDCLPSVFK